MISNQKLHSKTCYLLYKVCNFERIFKSYLKIVNPFSGTKITKESIEKATYPNKNFGFDYGMLPIRTNFNFQRLQRRSNVHFEICLKMFLKLWQNKNGQIHRDLSGSTHVLIGFWSGSSWSFWPLLMSVDALTSKKFGHVKILVKK